MPQKQHCLGSPESVRMYSLPGDACLAYIGSQKLRYPVPIQRITIPCDKEVGRTGIRVAVTGCILKQHLDHLMAQRDEALLFPFTHDAKITILQVDITSGKFVFSASEAYLIESGRLTRPVKGATLIGNGPDVLTRISMVGNDLALDPGIGTCGKDGQSVPVGVGLPTLRIDCLTVGGTAV